MNKNTKILFVVLAASLYLSPVAAYSFEDVAKGAQEGAVQQLEGTVVSVDIEEQQIVVQYPADGQNVATETAILSLSDSVTIVEDGQASDLSEIDEGDQVTVVYRADASGQKVVDRITIKG